MTTQQAAQKSGLKRRRVQEFCLQSGVAKFGRDYNITEADFYALMQRKGCLGRPKQERKK